MQAGAGGCNRLPEACDLVTRKVIGDDDGARGKGFIRSEK